MCEGDWSAYGVRDIIGDCVDFCVLQSCCTYYIGIYIGSCLYGFLSFGMGCQVGFCGLVLGDATDVALNLISHVFSMKPSRD